MTGRSADGEPPAGQDPAFATTRWSVVLEAARRSTPAGSSAQVPGELASAQE